jgi:hypothetical protein
MMRIPLSALIAGLSCLAASAQTGPCPCGNRAAALTHLTSSQPIPADHAACLKAIDDFARWLEQNESRVELPQFKKLFAPLLPGLVSVDWVVPSKAEVKDLAKFQRLDFNRAQLEQAEANLTKARQERYSGATLIALSDNVLMAEAFLRYDEAYEVYLKCLDAKGLAQ